MSNSLSASTCSGKLQETDAVELQSEFYFISLSVCLGFPRTLQHAHKPHEQGQSRHREAERRRRVRQGGIPVTLTHPDLGPWGWQRGSRIPRGTLPLPRVRQGGPGVPLTREAPERRVPPEPPSAAPSAAGRTGQRHPGCRRDSGPALCVRVCVRVPCPRTPTLRAAGGRSCHKLPVRG